MVNYLIMSFGQGDKSFKQCSKSKLLTLPFECKREIVGSDHLVVKRARKFRCRSKRIRLLATPKHLTPKFFKPPEMKIGKTIEITRPYENLLPTRIKLLAFPKVRKLLASHDAYRGMIKRERLKRIENLASRSLLTMYSRLANVQIPLKQQRTAKWTKEDWARHCEWLQKRACPKIERQPRRIKRKNVPLKKLLVSIYHLSMPRHQRTKYLPPHGYESVVKESAKIYEPTKRIITLSVPKKIHANEEEGGTEDYGVDPNALTYKPTRRIEELAIPKQLPKSTDTPDSEETPSGVLKRALKGAPTPRTVELSKPRAAGGDDDDEEKPNVNPKALKARATPRILELSKPREYPK